MKRCNNCDLDKPLDAFYIKKGRVVTPCKECCKEYYKGPTEKRRANNRAHYKRVTEKKRDLLFKRLFLSSCKDCGESDVVVLEFDHIKPKKYGIAQLVASLYPVSVLIEELKKCEVVCANCHRRRIAKKNGWYRSFAEAPHKVVKMPKILEDADTN